MALYIIKSKNRKPERRLFHKIFVIFIFSMSRLKSIEFEQL